MRSAPKRGPWHPKAWLIPDSQVLWYPFAVRRALGRAPTAGWDAVVGTSFPPTAILVAHTIAARLGIPYVADFRDAWTRYAGAPQRPPPLQALDRWLEARMVTDAAAVVTVATHMIEGVCGGLPEGERPPVQVIPNGYDEDDFRGASPPRLPRFSIVHTGQLRRAPSPLWEGLVHAIRERPELHGQVHVWQIGFVDAAAAPALGAPPDGVHVHVVPPVSQREAIGYMLAADLLLVEEFGQVMPSKTAQYLRAGRPILALLEQGNELRETLEHVSRAYLARREDAGRTADIVARLATAPREPARAPDEAVTAFSRRAIARRFAEVLAAACARHAGRALNRDGAQPRDAPRLANALGRSPRP